MAVRTTIREAQNGDQLREGDVVLLDEHPIWLDALETVLASEGIRVIGKATSPEAALALVDSERPDALIASIELAGSEMDGVECLRRARERWPELRTIAFLARHDPFSDSAAETAGADAYLAKTAQACEVVETIRTCLANGSQTKPKPRARGLKSSPARPALTARELEIVYLVAHGYTNVQIAERLWVTKSTVKFHLVNAFRKLGVSNRTQATRYLFEHGLSELSLDRIPTAPGGDASRLLRKDRTQRKS